MQHQAESMAGPNGEVTFNKVANIIHSSISSVSATTRQGPSSNSETHIVESVSSPRRKISSARDLSALLADKDSEIAAIKVQFQLLQEKNEILERQLNDKAV